MRKCSNATSGHNICRSGVQQPWLRDRRTAIRAASRCVNSNPPGPAGRRQHIARAAAGRHIATAERQRLQQSPPGERPKTQLLKPVHQLNNALPKARKPMQPQAPELQGAQLDSSLGPQAPTSAVNPAAAAEQPERRQEQRLGEASTATGTVIGAVALITGALLRPQNANDRALLDWCSLLLPFNRHRHETAQRQPCPSSEEEREPVPNWIVLVLTGPNP